MLCETTRLIGHLLDVIDGRVSQLPFEFGFPFSNPFCALWAFYGSQMDTEIILRDLEKVPFGVSVECCTYVR